MTYSLGVEPNCYSYPDQCSSYSWANPIGVPSKSWINNSNINSIWLITSNIDSGHDVFYISYGNINIDGARTKNYRGIRPTLYLSSSVKIIDGDGSINNPYKLSL